MVGTPASAAFRFYASEISYFSAKVRPALRWKGVPFREILPTPRAYREVILPRTGLGFIPVVVTPEDETWQDTSEILDALERRFPEPALYPTAPLQRLAGLLLELYADEFLLLPAMHYRWSFPESATRARADFAAASGDPSGAARFADRMAGSLLALGITPETAPAIEAHLAELLALLERHFRETPYLLGERPSLADCALMGPLYAHLLLDAVPGRLLRTSAPRVCHWIERMNHPEPETAGGWPEGDALPPGTRALLELVGRDAVPLLRDGVAAVERWAEQRPAGSETPPRAVGRHRTSLRGRAMERITSPYTLWMLQRSLDAWRALPAAGRARVERGLAGSGLEALLALTPRHRLGKRRFQLVFETVEG